MTLTELSFYSRRLMPAGIISVLMLMIFFYIFQILLLVTPDVAPGKPTLNTVFEKIKIPDIPEASRSAKYKFTLDTIEGQPVTATSAGYVYFLPPSTTKLQFKDKTYRMAQTIGIDTDVVKHQLINQIQYLFQDGTQKLTVDITNFNFSYDYKLELDQDILPDIKPPPSQPEIKNTAIDFLKSIGRYPDELSQGKLNIIYMNFNPATKTIDVVQDPKEANMVEVDFYRPDVQAYPIVSRKYFNSQNYVVLVYYRSLFKIVKAQVQFFEKSSEQVGMYPLKTGDKAWQDFVDGKGYVTVAPGGQKDIKIKQMFLGYYDPDIYQQYLQPIYVFLGENNFVGYVPAVDDAWLDQ
ncbi:MAG: hypothetical protein RI947_72 [Candidatus Parcubacteria bacterium]